MILGPRRCDTTLRVTEAALHIGEGRGWCRWSPRIKKATCSRVTVSRPRHGGEFQVVVAVWGCNQNCWPESLDQWRKGRTPLGDPIGGGYRWGWSEGSWGKRAGALAANAFNLARKKTGRGVWRYSACRTSRLIKLIPHSSTPFAQGVSRFMSRQWKPHWWMAFKPALTIALGLNSRIPALRNQLAANGFARRTTSCLISRWKLVNPRGCLRAAGANADAVLLEQGLWIADALQRLCSKGIGASHRDLGVPITGQA